MNVWRFLFLLSFAAASCSSPTYRPEASLTDDFFESSDGVLRGQIPQGWFAPPASDLPPHVAALLVRKDYSAMIFFQEIKVDEKTSRLIEQEGPVLLAKISFQLKQADEPSLVLIDAPEELPIEGKNIVRYEFRTANREGSTTVMVFRALDRYFESTIVSAKPFPASTHQELADIQQAVLFSIQH